MIKPPIIRKIIGFAKPITALSKLATPIMGCINSNIKEVYLETTRAKKETAQVSPFICQLDYFKWMFKYKVKKIVNARVR